MKTGQCLLISCALKRNYVLSNCAIYCCNIYCCDISNIMFPALLVLTSIQFYYFILNTLNVICYYKQIHEGNIKTEMKLNIHVLWNSVTYCIEREATIFNVCALNIKWGNYMVVHICYWTTFYYSLQTTSNTFYIFVVCLFMCTVRTQHHCTHKYSIHKH